MSATMESGPVTREITPRIARWVVAGLALVWAVPFWWMLVAAFRPAGSGADASLLPSLTPTLANFAQAIIYTLTTRLGAPGRDRYLLVLTLGMGLLGGWLTVATGGIAAAFIGHTITRFAVFLCTGHAGQTKPRGREVEEIEKRLESRAKAASAAVAAAAESLAKIYGAMKPAEAAPILDRLDDATVLTIFARMKEKQIGEILPLMSRERAIALTQSLAERH